jgi:hypothetical protein
LIGEHLMGHSQTGDSALIQQSAEAIGHSTWPQG